MSPPAVEPIPAEVVHLLVTRAGVPDSDSDVATMTKDQAIARLNEYWGRPS